MNIKSILFSLAVLGTVSACGPYTHHPVKFGQKAVMPSAKKTTASSNANSADPSTQDATGTSADPAATPDQGTPADGSASTTETPTAEASLPPENGPFGEIREIFQAKCALCHNANTGGNPPNWLDYTVVAGKLDAILTRVFVKKDMPMTGMPGLTAEEAQKLKAWLDAGAPR